jgi:hypothetical protein
MTLADIVGSTSAKQIEATGQLVFYSLGDTGRGPHTAEQSVAEAMARDIDPNNHARSPAFLLHLGDVIYGDGNRDLYDDEFYRPYADYHNKVVAVPGNHDGEEGVTMDKVSLEAFRENFCAPPGKQPPLAARFNCQMVNQPGVCWTLETKLLHLIGLYSNAAENFGILGNDAAKNVTNVGSAQLDWLQARLKKIKTSPGQGERKALIFAMHHPPYAKVCGPRSAGILAVRTCTSKWIKSATTSTSCRMRSFRHIRIATRIRNHNCAAKLGAASAHWAILNRCSFHRN